jgi:MinD-like ATPase involved in chromosome partitioning or flagellar assembly
MRVQAVAPHRATSVLAIASGNTGVGKTSVVANLAFALTKLQKTVLVMDADLGLGNLNTLLSSTPQYREVEIVFQKWHRATQQLLDIEISPLGGIPHDIHVQQAVRQQKTVVDMHPNAQASRAFP